MLQQRQKAESLAAKWHELEEKLAAMHVSQWAADESAALAQQAQQADSRFAAREYGAAIDGYQQAIRSAGQLQRSEEHTSELQSLMRISYAVFCLKKKNKQTRQ